VVASAGKILSTNAQHLRHVHRMMQHQMGRLGCIYQIPRLEKKTVQAVTKFYILLMTDKDQTDRGPENESTLPKFERLQLGKTPEFKEPAMPGFPSFLAGEALDIFLEGSNQLNCVTVWIGQC
jgi:hypothetical protein